MKGIIYAALVATLLTLAGCDHGQPVQTAEWYTAHPAERAQMIAQCKNDASLATDANCINASRADVATGNARRGYLDLGADDPKDKKGAK